MISIHILYHLKKWTFWILHYAAAFLEGSIFLGALAFFGSMLESQWVSEFFEILSTIALYLGRIFDIFGHIMGICWAYLEQILAISWKYPRHILGIFLAYFWHILCVSSPYLWLIFGLSKAYFWHILGISRLYLWHIMAFA